MLATAPETWKKLNINFRVCSDRVFHVTIANVDIGSLK